jgi:NADP-dependent 3-hydroxy acid dehydrogenase YdfG
MSALSKGNIAVVTGAASGIGLAAARRLAGMGLIVCMVDRSETALVAAAKEVGSNATPFVVDVAARQQCIAWRGKSPIGSAPFRF